MIVLQDSHEKEGAAIRESLSVLTETDHLVRTLYAASNGRRFCRGIYSICSALQDTKFIILSSLFRSG